MVMRAVRWARTGGLALTALHAIPGVDAAARPADRCAGSFPAPLKRAVARQYPGHMLPRERDNLAEDVAYSLAHGGSGCLGAATGDFDGDGRPDRALLLTRGGRTVLVVA